MTLTEEEYRELFQSIRLTVRGVGLGSIDEQLMLRLRESQGPFYDLTMYLRMFIEDISLGSDLQLRTVLHRLREVAETESGNAIEGFRVQFTPEEARLYKTEFFDFAPPPAIQEIVSELRSVLEELYSDWENRDSRDR